MNRIAGILLTAMLLLGLSLLSCGGSPTSSDDEGLDFPVFPTSP